jgi:hypothetical protein
MNEKRAVIEPGRTPPEKSGQKSAASLESHTTTRAAAHVKDALKKPDKSR